MFLRSFFLFFLLSLTAQAQNVPQANFANAADADVLESKAADLSQKGKMKDHFRKGMQYFARDKYEMAVPELLAATMVLDPYTWNYWYAEAYATLGVIYEFHLKTSDHLQKAHCYYALALKRDPNTHSAKYFMGHIKPVVSKK